MRKKNAYQLISLAMILGISACTSTNYATPSTVAYDSYKGAVPSVMPSSTSGFEGLRPGLLPDTSFSEDEKKLAGLIVRSVNVSFPVKVGVLLYNPNSNIDDLDRKSYYANFIEKLKSNQNISSVTEVSSSFVGINTNIEDLRKLAARFQVSFLLILNDKYQPTLENTKEQLLPSDIVFGNKNWESSSSIEALALDVLNGVFVYSSSAYSRVAEKYSQSVSKTKEPILTKKSSSQAWDQITQKVLTQLDEFKALVDKQNSSSTTTQK